MRKLSPKRHAKNLMARKYVQSPVLLDKTLIAFLTLCLHYLNMQRSLARMPEINLSLEKVTTWEK